MIKTRLPLVLHLFIAVLFFGVVTSCKDDDNPDPDMPEIAISSISPLTARVGETVTITGTGFSVERPSNTVLFKGNANNSATVVTASATELKVTVPAGATNGTISVTVGGKTATSAQEFVVDTSLGAPKITSINPTNGFVGTEVTIQGENFSTTANELSVLFNSTAAEIKSSTLTKIVAIVPQGLTEGNVSVTVKRSDKTSEAVTFVVDRLPVAVKVTYWSSIAGRTISRGVISEDKVEITTLYDSEDGLGAPAGVAIDTERNFIYWIDQNFASVVKAPLDGSGSPQTLFDLEDGLAFPTDIAIDVTDNILYFTDFVDDTHQYIRKVDLNTNTLGNVYELTEFSVPSGIKITVAAGKVYWTDNFNMRVYEGSLDGDVSKKKLLFDENDNLASPSGVAVDALNNKIYIVNNPDLGGTATDAIYSGNLSGEGTLTRIVQAGDDLTDASDIEIDLENGYIFWINSIDNGDIKRAKTDGSSVETLFGGINRGYFFDLDIR